MNIVYHGVSNESRTMKLFEKLGRDFIKKSFSDPALRAAVTPNSRYGCKRPLVSDDFYPALNRDNVKLIHSGAKEITATGCITADGMPIDADIIIYCTGYKVMDFDRIAVTGLQGKSLATEMEKAPEAYKGILVPGFPNYFMAAGPNALVLSVSYYKSIEANVANIVRLLDQMVDENIQAINAKADLTREYNDWIIKSCKNFSWGSGDCHNYYVNDAGQSPFLYPAPYKQYLKMRADCDLKYFDKINSSN
jgi:cation diffusion facilitator CzcD-associated flavoprotein CzcO